ncbi:hypothetical protein BDP27DRAFT_1430132 [Rhodocollybia butyracea]|uniref:Uncharacterized protein n=1 Tax=Rhodocollybia butyracea TaxID=206335 RepID=A0A9P5PBN4_9AGAR|nr:hypothetical protein BDP27DRAFT_1430132 [Rhodocollybia butyracea]
MSSLQNDQSPSPTLSDLEWLEKNANEVEAEARKIAEDKRAELKKKKLALEKAVEKVRKEKEEEQLQAKKTKQERIDREIMERNKVKSYLKREKDGSRKVKAEELAVGLKSSEDSSFSFVPSGSNKKSNTSPVRKASEKNENKTEVNLNKRKMEVIDPKDSSDQSDIDFLSDSEDSKPHFEESNAPLGNLRPMQTEKGTMLLDYPRNRSQKPLTKKHKTETDDSVVSPKKDRSNLLHHLSAIEEQNAEILRQNRDILLGAGLYKPQLSMGRTVVFGDPFHVSPQNLLEVLREINLTNEGGVSCKHYFRIVKPIQACAVGALRPNPPILPEATANVNTPFITNARFRNYRSSGGISTK